MNTKMVKAQEVDIDDYIEVAGVIFRVVENIPERIGGGPSRVELGLIPIGGNSTHYCKFVVPVNLTLYKATL